MLHQIGLQLELVHPLEICPSLGQFQVQFLDLATEVLNLIGLLVQLLLDDAWAVVPSIQGCGHIILRGDLDVLIGS